MWPPLLEPFPRDPAQEEAARELSKEMYRQEQSVLMQFLNWLQRWLIELFQGAQGSKEGGQFGLLVLVLLVLVLIIAVLVRFGPMARTRRDRRTESAELRPTLDTAAHRSRADQLAAEGRYAEAVRERLRAIIAGLIERGVLDERLSRTAAEVAAEAGRELPGAAAQLREAAELFGAIWYGRRTATAASDQRMQELDQAILAARRGHADGAEPAATGTWVLPGGGAR